MGFKIALHIINSHKTEVKSGLGNYFSPRATEAHRLFWRVVAGQVSTAPLLPSMPSTIIHQNSLCGMVKVVFRSGDGQARPGSQCRDNTGQGQGPGMGQVRTTIHFLHTPTDRCTSMSQGTQGMDRSSAPSWPCIVAAP